MKKLLSLLSVLTISGTAIPTTIAASSYQKEENLNSEINYSHNNNLEKLNRNKREYHYANNNQIECHDIKTNSAERLWIKISHSTWQRISADYDNLGHENLRNSLNLLFNSFSQRTTDCDVKDWHISHVTEVIIRRFNDINAVFLSKNNNNNIGLLIKTNTVESWTDTSSKWYGVSKLEWWT